jgi:hypothetical protein
MDTYFVEEYVNPDREMTKAFDPVFFCTAVSKIRLCAVKHIIARIVASL